MMLPDSNAALSAKLDLVIDRQDSIEKRLDSLQSSFDQSRGALSTIKLIAWFAGIAAAIYAAVKGLR